MIDSLLIKPAGPDCNMDCTYCFYKCKSEMFDNTAHRMNRETIEMVVKKLLSQGSGKYSVVFQGGEPTLCGVDFYKDFINIVNKHIKHGQIMNYSIQTNGLLIDENFCKFFAENKFLVGLSIDGNKDVNDRYRIDYSNKGTFDKAIKTIELLKKFNVDFNTLSVVTKSNVGKTQEIYEFLMKYGSGYMQFIPCLEVDENKKIRGFCMNPIEYGVFLCEMFDLWHNNGNPKNYVRFFDETLISYVTYKGVNCSTMTKCIAAPVVEYNGDVYPCDFFVTPELLLGNIHSVDFVEVENNEVFIEFRNKKWSEVSNECLKCKWKGLCFGDCCKNRLLKHDTSYFCESFKIFYEYSNPEYLNLKRSVQKNNESYYAYGKDIGRNDKCLCGSGDKYKNCCLLTKAT